MSVLTGSLRPRIQGRRLSLPVFNPALGASSSLCNAAFKKCFSAAPTIKNSLNSTSTVEVSQHQPEQRTGVRDVTPAPRKYQKPAKVSPGWKSRSSNLRLEDLRDSTPISSLLPFFGPIKLRDACNCSICVDESTQQKNFRTSQIPTSIRFGTVNFPTETVAQITWENDIPSMPETHVSEYTTQRLRSIMSRGHGEWKRVQWDRSRYKAHLGTNIKYDDFIGSAETFKKAMSDLSLYGLIFVTHIPSHGTNQEPSNQEIAAVSDIAKRIGPLYNSHYGLTWDVKSVPKAANVAYTNVDLGFHMDLLYKQSPPYIQLLHCLRNSRSGGESLFVDTFQAAENLWNRPKDGKEHFHTLMGRPIYFQYANDGQVFDKSRRTFTSYKSGFMPFDDTPSYTARRVRAGLRETTMPKLTGVYYSPPFQGPLSTAPYLQESGTWDSQALVRALRAFEEELNREEMIVEVKLEPGTCVIFENLRVAHARRAFAPAAEGEGFRWLRGAYVGKDDYFSKLRTLGLNSRE